MIITVHTQFHSCLSIFFILLLFLLSPIIKADESANNAIYNYKENFQIGLASVFVDRPRNILKQWAHYLSTRLEKNVSFIQRRTYQELTSSLLNENIMAAWVCTYPYLKNRDLFRLVAIPLYKNKPVYQSYFIVPHTDTRSKDISDMKNKIFAYTDNQSFTGYIYPRYLLKQAGLNTDQFFRIEFFTWGHVDSIKAVADGLANGAAVDGFIWDSLDLVSPDITRRTRIVSRSEDFGFPPIVVSYKMKDEDFISLQTILLHMQDDAQGKELLVELNLNGFIFPKEAIYHSASKLIDSFSTSKL